MPGFFDVQGPAASSETLKPAVLAIQTIIPLLALMVIILAITALSNTLISPSHPKGWGNGLLGLQRDYDALQGTRKSFTEYLVSKGIPDSTPMNQFTVATANFGGIFTEDIGFLTPWNGTVSPDAARLQVEAGARAVCLNVWPDPDDLRTPVVCTMTDTSTWPNWFGLNKGNGRYSNWQKRTRNVKPVGEIVKALITAAFDGPVSQQNTDPFFLIINLHGAMTLDYMNRLADTLTDAMGGHAMDASWGNSANQATLCSAPVSSFMSKVFLILVPDIQPTYNILPNINDYARFFAVFNDSKCKLGEIANAVQSQPNTLMFGPGEISTITAATQPACAASNVVVRGAASTAQFSLAQVGITVIQPSIGITSTRNAALFSQGSYSDCLKSGAQFVAVNLFSPDGSDPALSSFFDTFETFSFSKK